MKLIKPILMAFVGLLVLSACGGDSGGPLTADVDITLRNTLEEAEAPETAFPALFGSRTLRD